MSTQPNRIAGVGRIDRNQPIRFSFDGKEFGGFAGDTLASALMANDVKLVARSFKYHRPRGIFSAGPEEPNALIALRGGARQEANTRATVAELYDGLVATSQNNWPNLKYDTQAINQLIARFIPAGFYYKTFMGPFANTKIWMIFESVIRKAAGMGTATHQADPDRYERASAHCDVLVIGGGPAGLGAALTAAETGARVLLVDENPVLGGRRKHTGIDLAAPTGTPVYATADGVIGRADWFSSYGLYISINHGAKMETRYAHLSRLAVAAGDSVKKGDLIGYVGSTGRSTGPHLHYEVRVEGLAVNPIPYMVESEAQLAYVRDRALTGQGGE